MPESRYIIGIDLGTTNSVVSYVDTEKNETVELFRITQPVDEGAAEKRDMLPSFVFLPEAHDMSAGGTVLPWPEKNAGIIGEYARNRGEELPMRLVSSSKSWLCNPMIDRNSPVLPWKGDGDLSKLSPVEASSAILNHIRQAWNYEIAEGNEACFLENQDIFLTVPSSFDAVARELTVRAAKMAGIEKLTLLEEPQAAFYAWLGNAGEDWRNRLKKGDLVLVCDIGGGTTDFSLIQIAEEEGNLTLERIAVGNHLLVGGDNIDLALSYRIAQKLADKGTDLDAWQLSALGHSCRTAKENIMNSPDGRWPVTVLGRGSGLIAGVVREEVTSDDIRDIVVEGFFPECGINDRPAARRRTAIREQGLAYEADPSITRHLAAFLSVNRNEDGEIPVPTAVLFNGGIMKSDLIRKRISGILAAWQPEGREPVRELGSRDFDISVARGAAGFGLAKRGKGIRIRGGLERSYYVAIESSMPAVPGMPAPLKALCVAPQGMEEGSRARIDEEEFVIVTGETVLFDIMGSTCRHKDKPGTVLENWKEGELIDISTIETTLEGEYGRMIPVSFEIQVTEIGTLEFWCVAKEDGQRWKLEFSVREQDD